MKPSIDFETYSEAGYHRIPAGTWKAVSSQNPGIKGVGAWVYTRHPSADLISLAYDDTVWIPGMPPPTDLFDYLARSGTYLYAWNSFFEFCAWNNIGVRKYGWPPLPLEKLRCSMSRARAWGLPGALEKVGDCLGLDDRFLKDPVGKRLKRLLTIPRTATKTNPLERLTPDSSPEDFGRFYEYNLQDTISESAICAQTPELTTTETTLWLLDQRINARGAHIDRAAMEDCISIVNQAFAQYTQELRDITGGAVQTVGELDKMRTWLETVGVSAVTLDAAVVEKLLAITDDTVPPPARRVLQIRQILGSASVKKLFTIQRHLDRDDDRIRGIFAYCGAERTGRFAGLGPQPHNMPSGGPAVRQCPTCKTVQWEGLKQCRFCSMMISSDLGNSDWCVEAVELALGDITTCDLSVVERYWGDPLDVVSGCLRGLYTAAPGMGFICSDYSAIEAVVLACLAGEEWRIDVFRTHGKIYEMSAAKISGVPFEEIIGYKKSHGCHHPLRKKLGKVAELASGYAGWIGAWKAFGADKHLSDQEIKNAILKWRDESPAIVEFWGGQYRKHPDRWEFVPELFGLEGAVVSAILSPGQCFSYRSISYGVKDDVLYCLLPSGRKLAYHQPRLVQTWDEMRNVWYHKISFMGYNNNPKMGAMGWARIETYSGKLTENCVQAVSRDILTDAMPRLEAAGYPIVLHVHDEVVAEVPEGRGSIEEFENIMKTPPAWARDWPIKAAGGWRGRRYRK